MSLFVLDPHKIRHSRSSSLPVWSQRKPSYSHPAAASRSHSEWKFLQKYHSISLLLVLWEWAKFFSEIIFCSFTEVPKPSTIINVCIVKNFKNWWFFDFDSFIVLFSLFSVLWDDGCCWWWDGKKFFWRNYSSSLLFARCRGSDAKSSFMGLAAGIGHTYWHFARPKLSPSLVSSFSSSKIFCSRCCFCLNWLNWTIAVSVNKFIL